MRVLCFALVAALAFAAKFPEEDGVLVLDDDNLESALETYDTLLVEFYAPWCGHCKRLAPEYAKAAQALAKDDLFIAKVDATANRESGEKYGVQGYPTLKFFKNGRATEYTGGRTEADIIQWVRKKSGPAAKTLESADEATEFSESGEVAVVGFFKSADGEDAKAFLTAAGQNDDVAFGLTTDAAAAKALKASVPSVVLFKKFDEGRAEYDGKLADAEALATFVAGNQLPLVVPFTQENAPKIFGGSINTHVLMFLDTEDDAAEGLLTEFKEVAVANKGRALCVSVGLDSDRVMDYFGVKEADLPTAVLVNMPEGESMKKFLFDGEVNGAELTAFAESYFSGDLKPFLKSEDIPEQDGPVYVMVGKAFDDVALDKSKDVLLEFYAPWCGHCKSLAPIYDQLGEHFADIDSVVIAKMDATANEVDHPDVNVRGFPTIKFFPANSDQVIDYEGARDFDGFVEFLKENTAIPFELDGESFGADHSEL